MMLLVMLLVISVVANLIIKSKANMQNYLETTGDTEGVELVNGTLQGKCFEESWFFYEHVPVG